MDKILTPEHEAKLAAIGSKIKYTGKGRRGWKSAATRLAIDLLYALIVEQGFSYEAIIADIMISRKP